MTNPRLIEALAKLVEGVKLVGDALTTLLKRAFGEFCMAKTMKNITRELMTKVYIYNMLINL